VKLWQVNWEGSENIIEDPEWINMDSAKECPVGLVVEFLLAAEQSEEKDWLYRDDNLYFLLVIAKNVS